MAKGLLLALAVFVVAVSWTAIHLVFTVRYGDLYYNDPAGGIDFNQKDRPDYRDFTYFAFTVGMTFQVSDTTVTRQVDPPAGDPARAPLVPLRGRHRRPGDQRRRHASAVAPWAEWASGVAKWGDSGLKWGAVEACC